METTLLLLIRGSTESAVIRAALKVTTKTLYVFMQGHNQSAASADLLTFVARLYDITADEHPRLNVVPLLGFAGWTPERLAQLQNLQTVLYPTGGAADALSKQLQELRPSGLSPLTVKKLEGLRAEDDVASWAAQSHVEVTGVSGQQLLAFGKVAIGGTFDRLHAGHRSLLSAAALVSTSYVFIGVTGERLLEHKKFAELLQRYEERERAAADFVQSIRPQLRVVTGPLLDPKKRTAAAEDREMQALVVSQETRGGGEAINQDREQQGFPPLALVAVALLGKGSAALGGESLSSTALRERERPQVAIGLGGIERIPH